MPCFNPITGTFDAATVSLYPVIPLFYNSHSYLLAIFIQFKIYLNMPEEAAAIWTLRFCFPYNKIVSFSVLYSTISATFPTREVENMDQWLHFTSFVLLGTKKKKKKTLARSHTS